jgi:hypothetical protein
VVELTTMQQKAVELCTRADAGMSWWLATRDATLEAKDYKTPGCETE